MNIVVVDDESIYLNLLTEILTLYGHTVFKAASAPAALEQLRLESVDLIISDVSMPGMNGVSFHGEVREDPRFRRLPFIWNTGYAELQELLEVVDPALDFKVDKSKGLSTLLHLVARFDAARRVSVHVPAY
ncbi:MAG: response regulator [Bacteroidota bacterium]